MLNVNKLYYSGLGKSLWQWNLIFNVEQEVARRQWLTGLKCLSLKWGCPLHSKKLPLLVWWWWRTLVINLKLFQNNQQLANYSLKLLSRLDTIQQWMWCLEQEKYFRSPCYHPNLFILLILHLNTVLRHHMDWWNKFLWKMGFDVLLYSLDVGCIWVDAC